MSFRPRPIAAWALLLTACGGSSTLSGDPTPDAAPSSDAGSSAAYDARVDTSLDSADASGDAGSVDGAASTCSPQSAPSIQSVQVVVTNSATSERFLVTAGTWCDPYSFSFSQEGALPLSIGFQCLCECPNPGSPRPATLRRLAPGESFTLTWDARSLTTCSETIDCATMGWPALGTASKLIGAATPVAPGLYWASAAALITVPQGCSGDGTIYHCPMNVSGVPSGTTPAAIQKMCPAEVTAQAAFTLPASGDVSVPITITN